MEASGTLSTVLGEIDSIVGSAIGWMGDYMDVIADRPLLLIFCCIPLVGLGVGLIKRMISL